MTLIPPSFSFKGDRQKSISLKAQARQFYNFIVNQAELGGIPFINRSLVLSDGSIISIVSKKESIYGHRTGTIFINTVPTVIERIVAEKLYMESGFLQLGMTATCNELTFLPATLHYNDPIQSYTSSPLPLEGKADIDEDKEAIDTPYYGETLVEGYTSKTLVGTLDTTVTDLCGNIYTSDEKIYGTQTTWQCKYAQRYVPASLYSGKLRLYVQAVYGSTSQDYSVVPLTLSTATTYDLVLKGYRLNQGIATSGIFTTSDYTYYMMECNVNSVTFKKLKINGTARGWLDILKAHPNRTDREFSSKVEAYVLSTAVIDPDFTPVVSSTGLSVSEGTPYAYGFHFNWAGNQAKVVWHRSIGDNTYRARTITLDIADDLTVIGAESGEQAWSNSQYFQFWYPDMFEGVMKTAGTIPANPINSGGCPMYGYFNYLDEWEVFSVSCSVSGSAPAYTTGPLTQAHLDGGYGLDAFNYEWNTKSATSNTNGSIGYLFGDESVTGPVGSNRTLIYSKNSNVVNWETSISPDSSFGGGGDEIRGGLYTGEYMASRWPIGTKIYGWTPKTPSGWRISVIGSSPYIPNTVGWVTDNNKYGSDALTVDLTDAKRFTGATEIMEVSFAVPFGDCETIVYGSIQGTSYSEKAIGRATMFSCIHNPRMKIPLVSYNSSGVPTSTPGVFEYVDKKQRVVSATNTPSFYPVSTTGPGVETTTTIVFKSSNTNGWTHNESDSYLIKSSTDSVTLPTWAEKYFRVGDLSGLYHPTMQARASANGAHILYHDEGTGKNENGFPDGIYSSVGWS